MKFAIITHVPHIKAENQYFAYSPYVNEMNIWLKYADELIIVALIKVTDRTAIDSAYSFDNIHFVPIDKINLLGLAAFFKVPKICWQIFKAMNQADHIHLRCPGNIGLLGCLVQMVFPGKSKTAKYAGNWDPKSKQPWSYRLQKWILSNTFLTRNMQVLVYGEWDGMTKNIKPFFTASYSEEEKVPLRELNLKATINFVFVGTLSQGKNPLYAIELVEALFKKGHNVFLDLYGEGAERLVLENYIKANGLRECITMKGNQNREIIKNAYQNSHFVILPSKSEGWPKAIAEGMFWGCVPLATSVSCVPFMLDYGKRGLLLQMDLQHDLEQLEKVLSSQTAFGTIREKAMNWSRQYTINVFEAEIKKMLVQ